MVPQDSKPTIPAGEYPQRWSRVQEMMGQQDLDFLMAYADDRAVFGPAHARWLADFPVHFEPVCVLIPPQGEPVMLVGPESDQYALLAGHIPNVQVLQEFTHPDEDYPFSQIHPLTEIMGAVAGDLKSVKRIGLAGRGLIGVDVMSAFRKALPQAQWVDVENAVCNLRAVKTPAEIEVTRYAYKIAEVALQAGLDAIEVGVTERQVAAEIESAMRRHGAEGTGIDTIVASGPNSRPILGRSTFRRIQANELVLLTVVPRYEGYHGAIGRPVLVGDPGDQITHAVAVASKAQESCFKALRPGIEGREVEAIGRGILKQAGLESFFLYSGVHSVGVVEFEPPIFGPSSSAKLEENMVISVDIPLFNTPWGGFRIEDGYLITATGAERLNNTPYKIQK